MVGIKMSIGGNIIILISKPTKHWLSEIRPLNLLYIYADSCETSYHNTTWRKVYPTKVCIDEMMLKNLFYSLFTFSIDDTC